MRIVILLLALELVLGAGETLNPDSFSVSYNYWAWTRSQRAQGALDLREYEAWQRVKSDFRRLEKAVDAEYRGEK